MSVRYQLYKFVGGSKIPDGHSFHSLIDCLLHAHSMLKGLVNTDKLDQLVPTKDGAGIWWVIEKSYEKIY